MCLEVLELYVSTFISHQLPEVRGARSTRCLCGYKVFVVMHARLANRLMMTAEQREAEWLAIEAKAKESPLYDKLINKPTKWLSKRPSAVFAKKQPPTEEEDTGEAEKAAEVAAAALIAEEEAEKMARAKKKPGRKGKQKQAKQTAATAAAPAPALTLSTAPLTPAPAAALAQRHSTEHASPPEAEPNDEPARAPPPPPSHVDRPQLLVGGTSLEDQHRSSNDLTVDQLADERVALVTAALAVRAWDLGPRSRSPVLP